MWRESAMIWIAGAPPVGFFNTEQLQLYRYTMLYLPSAGETMLTGGMAM